MAPRFLFALLSFTVSTSLFATVVAHVPASGEAILEHNYNPPNYPLSDSLSAATAPDGGLFLAAHFSWFALDEELYLRASASASHCSVASNSTGVLVACADAGWLIATLHDSSGRILIEKQFYGSNEARPNLATDGRNWLIISGTHLWFVDDSLELIHNAEVPVVGGRVLSAARAAWTGASFLLTWTESENCHLAPCQGQPLRFPEIGIFDTTSGTIARRDFPYSSTYSAAIPSCFNGACAIVWDGDRGIDAGLLMQRFSREGAALGDEPTRLGDVSPAFDLINDGRSFVATFATRGASREFLVRTTRLDATRNWTDEEAALRTVHTLTIDDVPPYGDQIATTMTHDDKLLVEYVRGDDSGDARWYLIATQILDDLAARAPEAPSEVRASSVGARVELSWQDESEYERGYRIEYREGDGAWQSLQDAPANATSAVTGELTRGKTYSFRVRAFSSGAIGEPSDEVSITIPLGRRRSVRP